MKKILLVVLILIIGTLQGFCANTSTISQIETSIFGFEYTNESNTKRIERIEEHLYGTAKSGNIQKRIEDIQTDIGFVDKTEIEKIAKEKEAAELKKQEEEKLAKIKSLQEDGSVEYPIVDKIEDIVFNKNYKNEDIYTRLNRLETQVLQKKNDTASLNDRVDKLASIILPNGIAQEETNIPNQAQTTEIYNSGIPTTNGQSLPFQLAVLEQNVLNNTYNNDNIANRLSRLEEAMFNRTFANDNDVARLQRIMVTYEAKQNSYKYENNRKMQKMATASQFGGILLMILAMLL